jgi:hypothetical protein
MSYPDVVAKHDSVVPSPLKDLLIILAKTIELASIGEVMRS